MGQTSVSIINQSSRKNKLFKFSLRGTWMLGASFMAMHPKVVKIHIEIRGKATRIHHL